MPNVVVIDDRVTNRNVLTRLAASVEEGVRVKAFASPQAALEWVQGAMPDLVITDFKMPGMDGADFTRAFRAMPGASTSCAWPRRRIPVASTSWSDGTPMTPSS